MTNPFKDAVPEIVSHEEALELAYYRSKNSNLARCYIALSEKCRGLADGREVIVPADYRKTVLEEAAAAVRANCSACDGSGVYASNYGFIDQCEYCGRPMAAIGSLSASPQEKP
jgi:hypothetical protein